MALKSPEHPSDKPLCFSQESQRPPPFAYYTEWMPRRGIGFDTYGKGTVQPDKRGDTTLISHRMIIL